MKEVPESHYNRVPDRLNDSIKLLKFQQKLRLSDYIPISILSILRVDLRQTLESTIHCCLLRTVFPNYLVHRRYYHPPEKLNINLLIKLFTYNETIVKRTCRYLKLTLSRLIGELQFTTIMELQSMIQYQKNSPINIFRPETV